MVGNRLIEIMDMHRSMMDHRLDRDNLLPTFASLWPKYLTDEGRKDLCALTIPREQSVREAQGLCLCWWELVVSFFTCWQVRGRRHLDYSHKWVLPYRSTPPEVTVPRGPQPLQTEPLARDYMFRHMNLRGTFDIQTRQKIDWYRETDGRNWFAWVQGMVNL